MASEHALPEVVTFPRASRIGASVDRLGEGPVWDERENCAYYVDILGRSVYRLAGPDWSQRDVLYASDRPVTCVLPAEDGGLLIVESDRLVTRSVEGDLRLGPGLIDDPERRFNDGICDPQGRLLVGTLHGGEVSGEETLIRVDASGQVEVLLRGLTLSNGLGFDVAGERLYHVDTLRHTVSTYDYSNPALTLLHSFDVDGGYPDGLTVDAEGCLWVAVWGGSEVRRYTPAGQLIGRMPVDAEQVTSAAFIGEQCDTMLITTAADGINPAGAGDGGLFVALAPARGVVGSRWGGATRG